MCHSLMFALPPIATATATGRVVAKCRKQPKCAAAKGGLFDHLVGDGEQRWRDNEAECLSRCQVEDEIEPSRLLDWDIARSRPAQNLIGELSGATVQIG